MRTGCFAEPPSPFGFQVLYPRHGIPTRVSLAALAALAIAVKLMPRPGMACLIPRLQRPARLAFLSAPNSADGFTYREIRVRVCIHVLLDVPGCLPARRIAGDGMVPFFLVPAHIINPHHGREH